MPLKICLGWSVSVEVVIYHTSLLENTVIKQYTTLRGTMDRRDASPKRAQAPRPARAANALGAPSDHRTAVTTTADASAAASVVVPPPQGLRQSAVLLPTSPPPAYGAYPTLPAPYDIDPRLAHTLPSLPAGRGPLAPSSRLGSASSTTGQGLPPSPQVLGLGLAAGSGSAAALQDWDSSSAAGRGIPRVPQGWSSPPAAGLGNPLAPQGWGSPPAAGFGNTLAPKAWSSLPAVGLGSILVAPGWSSPPAVAFGARSPLQARGSTHAAGNALVPQGWSAPAAAPAAWPPSPSSIRRSTLQGALDAYPVPVAPDGGAATLPSLASLRRSSSQGLYASTNASPGASARVEGVRSLPEPGGRTVYDHELEAAAGRDRARMSSTQSIGSARGTLEEGDNIKVPAALNPERAADLTATPAGCTPTCYVQIALSHTAFEHNQSCCGAGARADVQHAPSQLGTRYPRGQHQGACCLSTSMAHAAIHPCQCPAPRSLSNHAAQSKPELLRFGNARG